MRTKLLETLVVCVLSCAGTTSCYDDAASGEVSYAGNDVGDDPSDAYLATSEPVYYDGHATYWYNNAWRYREGGRWTTYRTEPAQLRESRIQLTTRLASRRFEAPRGTRDHRR